MEDIFQIQTQIIKDLDLLAFIVDLDGNIAFKNDTAILLEKTDSSYCDVILKQIDDVIKASFKSQLNEKVDDQILIDSKSKKVTAKKILEDYILITVIDDIGKMSEKEQFSEKLGLVTSSYRHHIYSIYNLLAPISQILDQFEQYDDMKYLNSISSNCEQMLKEVENINQYNEMIQDDYTFEKEYNQINFVLKKECKKIEYILLNNDIDFSFKNFDENMICNIPEKLLNIVLLNLISNSVYFRQKNPDITPKVEVSLSRIQNNAMISIKDNSMGIKSEYLRFVFDPFFSYDPNNGCKKGLGLGMTLAKLIIEKYNGSIMLSSTENVGTNINIRLPLVDEVNVEDLNFNSNAGRHLGITQERIYFSDSFDFVLF